MFYDDSCGFEIHSNMILDIKQGEMDFDDHGRPAGGRDKNKKEEVDSDDEGSEDAGGDDGGGSDSE